MDIRRRNPIFLPFVASLMLAVAIVVRALSLGFALWDIAGLWPLILVCPAVLGFYCRLVAGVARRHALLADVPRSADFERNSRRVGMVGRRYLVGIGLVVLLLQAQWLAGTLGLHVEYGALARGLLVLLGALMIYFGNVLPRMQPLAGVTSDPETFRVSARALGWVSVIGGAGICLGALLFDLTAYLAAWLTAFVAIMAACILAVAIPRLVKSRKER